MKISKKSVKKQGRTMSYWVPLFICHALEKGLKNDGLNLDEIKLRLYETVEAEFDISTVERVTLNCFPNNKPIKNPENKIIFCDSCPEIKEIFMKVFVEKDLKGEQKKSKTVAYRLVSGFQGLRFKRKENNG